MFTPREFNAKHPRPLSIAFLLHVRMTSTLKEGFRQFVLNKNAGDRKVTNVGIKRYIKDRSRYIS